MRSFLIELSNCSDTGFLIGNLCAQSNTRERRMRFKRRKNQLQTKSELYRASFFLHKLRIKEIDAHTVLLFSHMRGRTHFNKSGQFERVKHRLNKL